MEKGRGNGSGLRSLADLAEGAGGRIAAVEIGEDADLRRLEVMGLCPGRVVEVVKKGDPMIVRVLGTRIGLAVSLAGATLVEPHPAPGGGR